uniref:Ig-like domain-containing protein n=1 Tax=Chelydra serpentina TaxID=8475 RepID=A0A8C3SB57_CHESE
MGISFILLCLFLLFCLTGHTDAKITQTTSLVLKRGQTAQLTCRQTDGHNYMYWYQQQQGKGLQLIYYSITVDDKTEGDIKDGFTVSRLQIEVFDLNITSVKMEHSAVYFCASSLDTVLQSHLLPLQKPPTFSPHSLRESSSSPLHIKRRTYYYQAERNSSLFIETIAKSCWGRSDQRQRNPVEY